jgi:hypothetical protein
MIKELAMPANRAQAALNISGTYTGGNSSRDTNHRKIAISTRLSGLNLEQVVNAKVSDDEANL